MQMYVINEILMYNLQIDKQHFNKDKYFSDILQCIYKYKNMQCT